LRRAEFDDENVRELVSTSYRLTYRLIAAVIHGKRTLTATEQLGENP
jgi:hypothetical protein